MIDQNLAYDAITYLGMQVAMVEQIGTLVPEVKIQYFPFALEDHSKDDLPTYTKLFEKERTRFH